MRCQLCPREADGALCQYHQAAHEELIRTFERWRVAYSSLSWSSYLERIVRLDDAGQWVKDVAQFELSNLQGR